MLKLGDMTVFAADAKSALAPSLNFAKALAVLGTRLRGLMLVEGYRTKDSCILTALTVRDFLQSVGFEDARAVSAMFFVRASAGERPVHSLGIGATHDGKAERTRWAGHLVVVLPRVGWLVDASMEQAQREQWPMITAMGASLLRSPVKLGKSDRTIAGFVYGRGDDYVVEAAWIAQPNNAQWKRAPDSIPVRRMAIVEALRRDFAFSEDSCRESAQ